MGHVFDPQFFMQGPRLFEFLQDTGWNSLYFNSHDQPRMVSRFGDDGTFGREIATLLATCLHLMQGTPFVYPGEEIGMTNVSFAAMEDYPDIDSVNGFKELVENQDLTHEGALEKVHFHSRDNARTPMPWDASPGAGFTEETPWLPLNPNHDTVNVMAERDDPDSVLSYYKRLFALRKQHPVMIYGRYDLVADTDPWLYAFTRAEGETRLLVLCNFSGHRVAVPCTDGVAPCSGGLLIRNYPEAQDDADRLTLRPYEARVYRMV